MNDQIHIINVINELDRCGIKYEFATDNEVKTCCPFHKDKTPSCSINTEKNLFKCHTAVCNAKGDIVTFLAKALKTTRRVIWEDLSTRYELSASKTINASVIEKYHEAIWKAKPLLKELYNRGVTDEMIRKHRLGFDDGRISIPVYNENNLVVNVRRYSPGAPGPEKMKNKRGHGKIRLYPVEQLKYDTIILCGGEIKAIVAASLLNKHKIGAITATAGEGNWHKDLSAQLKDKKVYVCFDIDSAGTVGANNVSTQLKASAKWIGIVELTLDVDQYPNGDINDYFGVEKKTANDFLKLLKDVKEWTVKLKQSINMSEEPIDLHLNQASHAKYTGERIKLNATVTAMDTAPYVIPKRIRVSCQRNQPLCGACPVFAKQSNELNEVLMEIPAESPAILEMVATSKATQRDSIMLGLQLPMCKVVELIPDQFYNVEDVRLSPQLEISSRAVDDILQPALCVGHELETNESYTFTGRMYPHPKSQQSVILASSYETTSDALSSYEPSVAELENLKLFQPKKWTVESIEEKLNDIYGDLSANVTHIFQRKRLHLAIDLTYHSVLLFKFDQKLIKGWVELLIAGDSSQGKSETILRLMEHYGLGERVECKNATVAGLLGGLQQMNSSNRWFVTWGIIPTHDKRLVILEEIKGTSTDVIGKLTDMRSSGVAELPKIEKRRTHARTRLIAVSNPRSDMPLSAYNFGIEAIKELIGGLEDIRRFDFSILTSADEIDVDTLNQLQRYRPKIKHKYKDKECKELILWAWTRKPEQVIFTSEATDFALVEATRLCSIFTELIPIVDRGSMRFKICRLAISLACRTFSNHNLRSVKVRKCHVEYITKFLEETYSESMFGYKDFSDAISANSKLLNPEILKTHILQSPFPSDFIQQLLYNNEIEFRDICDWCGWEKGPTAQLLSLFVRKNALRRDGRGYRKTPSFIQFLKGLLVSKELEICKRPEFIEEEF